MNIKEKRYRQALAELPSHVHGRNGQLLGIARLGLNAGRDAATLETEIIAAGGEPLLTHSEVSRAINKAARQNGVKVVPSKGRHSVRWKRITTNEKEQNFVRRLIDVGKGTKSGDLMAISPVSVKGAAVWAEFLRRIFRPGELVFAGTPYLPRTRENLHSVEELVRQFESSGAELPTHIIPNPFTGEAGKNSEGRESYVLDATVAHRRMALIEFDELPLADQAAFWMGVIKERLLAVRALVYSGAKSIHGLIELEDDGSAAKWAEQWRILERLLCSDPDAHFHADRLCKNPSRFTRFPGAIRPETHRRQALLYLDVGVAAAELA